VVLGLLPARVYSINPDGTENVSSNAWRANLRDSVATRRDLLCVSCVDTGFLRFGKDSVREFADISDYCGFWANDMLVSPTGYSYVGNFGFDLDTMLAEIGVEGMLASPPPTTNLVVLNQDGGSSIGAAWPFPTARSSAPTAPLSSWVRQWPFASRLLTSTPTAP